MWKMNFSFDENGGELVGLHTTQSGCEFDLLAVLVILKIVKGCAIMSDQAMLQINSSIGNMNVQLHERITFSLTMSFVSEHGNGLQIKHLKTTKYSSCLTQ